MTVEAKTYTIPPTQLIPNSPYQLIHYPRLLHTLVSSPSFNPTAIFDLFASNGWQSQWIARYGRTQKSHYHSTAHEAMVVISGEGATIRFGVADENADPLAEPEAPGLLLEAQLGDVFILPAGVAHKTHDPRPDAESLKFMAPKDVKNGRSAREYFEAQEVKGEFMMMGAYPEGNEWDFMVGGEHEGRFEEVWNVEKPGSDPVLGASEEGICGLWKSSTV
ncbi:hypothetical protein BDV96DRAFT_589984 [Lophiotrema nucula]|uniref:Cupin type-1 domain-containing protein n=1 Tax=Lophiotrema nucula TaxID=690887 RepID=A0A6A5YIZ2_9PLEO|nr:hypothetical protein BDV96DRAFT_589984 [Lophiotrema nucula]